MGLFRDSNQRHGTAVTKQSKVCVETVRYSEGIQDEIELARLCAHLLWIRRDNHLVGA
jgi:hypothetical protein